MTLEEALQWADTFGPIQSDPPGGDAPALLTLAAEVRRLQSLLRNIVEQPDDPARGVQVRLPFSVEADARAASNYQEKGTP